MESFVRRSKLNKELGTKDDETANKILKNLLEGKTCDNCFRRR